MVVVAAVVYPVVAGVVGWWGRCSVDRRLGGWRISWLVEINLPTSQLTDPAMDLRSLRNQI